MTSTAPDHRALWPALAACAAVYLLHVGWYWPWAEDDAFITFRYGVHLAFGMGLEYNPGVAVEGYSNFLWVLLAWAAVKVGVDPLLLARLVAGACGVGVLVLSWRLACVLAGRANWAALFAPLFLAATPILPRHATSGLETVPFAFLLALATLLALTGRRARGSAGFAGVLVLLALMRPEGFAFAAVLLLWRSGSGRRTGGLVRLEIAVFTVAMIAYLAWRWTTFGALLPNTFHAKVTGEAAAWREGLHYALDFLRENGGGVLAGLYAANLLRDPIPRAWGLLTLLVALQTGVVILAGGDWMHYYRFFAPVLPLLAAGAAAGLDGVLSHLRGPHWPDARRRLAYAVLAVALGVAWMNVAKSERATARLVLPAVKAGTYLTDAYRETAAWIDAHVPPDRSVAACDIGMLGWELDREIVDMFGLIDPHVARQEGRPHFKNDPDHVLARRPGAVVLVRDVAGGYLRVPDRALKEHPEFAARYALAHEIAVGFRGETVEIYTNRLAPAE